MPASVRSALDRLGYENYVDAELDSLAQHFASQMVEADETEDEIQIPKGNIYIRVPFPLRSKLFKTGTCHRYQ
jgi:hypothetical protein